MNEFANIVKNKNVLLVGNSSFILEQNKAEYIDSMEFVIRFNLAPLHQHKHYANIGRKIDAWFFTMMSEEKCKRVYNSARIKPDHCIRHHSSPLPIGKNNYFIDTEIYRNKFKKQLNIDEWPSSGLCLVHYLIEYCSPKSLSLIGFDSFKNHNFYTNASNAHLVHNLDVEKTYINKLRSKNKIKVFI